MSFLDEIRKVKWIKYSDKKPSDFGAIDIWVTNGDDVWPAVVGLSLFIESDKNLTHWAVRENPAPPEKEKHICYSKPSGTWDCSETKDNLLILTDTYLGRRLEVKFCPFCAYTIEKKIHD